VAAGHPFLENSEKIQHCLSDSEIEDSRIPLKTKVREQFVGFQN
jgi:hypothetical protein